MVMLMFCTSNPKATLIHARRMAVESVVRRLLYRVCWVELLKILTHIRAWSTPKYRVVVRQAIVSYSRQSEATACSCSMYVHTYSSPLRYLVLETRVSSLWYPSPQAPSVEQNLSLLAHAISWPLAWRRPFCGERRFRTTLFIRGSITGRGREGDPTVHGRH
jgi:hypothetical protein